MPDILCAVPHGVRSSQSDVKDTIESGAYDLLQTPRAVMIDMSNARKPVKLVQDGSLRQVCARVHGHCRHVCIIPFATLVTDLSPIS